MEYNGRFGDAGDLYLAEMYVKTKRLLLESFRGFRSDFFMWLVDSSVNPKANIIAKVLSVVFGIILVLLSPIILPILVVISFISGKNFIEPILYVYYGMLGGWGERSNKPLGYILVLSPIIGLLGILTENFIRFEWCYNLTYNLSSLKITISEINFWIFLKLFLKLTLHSLFVMFFPFIFNSPFLPENTNVCTHVLLFLARIFGVVLITMFIIAIRRRFSRTTSQ